MTNPNKTLALLPSLKLNTVQTILEFCLSKWEVFMWLLFVLMRFVLVLTQFKRAHLSKCALSRQSRQFIFQLSSFPQLLWSQHSGNNLILSRQGRYLESGPIIIILLHSAIYGDQRKYLWSFQCRCWTEREREPLRQTRPKPFNTSLLSWPSNLINYLITLSTPGCGYCWMQKSVSLCW